MLETTLFGIFSTLLLCASVMVIYHPQTIHRALWLVLSFISTASLWLSLHAEFLSLILILVYVGAVLTLFLFVVMTISIHSTVWDGILYRYLPILIGILAGLGCVVQAIYHHLSYGYHFSSAKTQHLSITDNNIRQLGIELYSYYYYPFILAGILLLVAIIVTINLHPHHKHEGIASKTLTKSEQLTIKRENRIKLVTGN